MPCGMRIQCIALALVLAGCPSGPATDGGMGGPAPQLSAVMPSSGPAGGGTVVTLTGSNFVDGARVRFGAAVATQVLVESPLRITARSPAGTGRVAVTVVNPDGQSASVANGFSYEGTMGGATVSESVLRGPADRVDTSGASSVSVAISAEVEVPGVTRGMGAGSGIKAQVGFAAMVSMPPTSADFTWVDATYESDADGAMPMARDVYGAQVMLPGISMGMPRAYRLAARFSVDNGTTWVLADLDGSANGFSANQLGQVRLETKGVDWCRLGGRMQDPAPNVMLRQGQQSPLLFAQVFVMGRTEGAGAAQGVVGQLGVGVGNDPSSWQWVDGTFNVDVGNNDEWQARLPSLGVGSYRFAWRFTVTGGGNSLCDADGLANGFDISQAGTLTVSAAIGATIERCNLQFPQTAQAAPQMTGPLAYGRVFAPGLSDVADAGSGLRMELGIGDAGTTPDGNWRWQLGSINVSVAGGGLEYQAPLPGLAEGTYAFAWRAQLADGGATALCDLDGSQNGYSQAQAGVYTVATPRLTECRLQFPATLDVAEGAASDLVYARLFSAQLMTSADGGAPANVQAELGYGPLGSSPDAGWSWASAAFNVLVPGGLEYQARLIGPTAGSYSFAYRARFAGGEWLFCDRDGASNGYQSAQAGALTSRVVDVDQCFVDTVSQDVQPSMMSAPYVARVRVPGVTSQSGQAMGVTVEVGYGPASQTPSAWSTWSPASFQADAMDFDAYRGSVTAPAQVGQQLVAFRARLGNRPFVYCDSDGSQNGFQTAQAAQLSVSTTQLQSCQLLAPSGFSVASGSPLTVSVSVLGTATGQAGAASGFRAQVGLGPRDNASTSQFWGWADATFARDQNMSDVYALTFSPSYTGDRAVSARVSTNNGSSWQYCDLNGSDVNGYEVSQQYNVSVERHATIQFCKTQFPNAFARDAGLTRIYGQLFQSGLTPDAGSAVRADFGYGEQTQEPGLTWQWRAARFFGFAGNNNEYSYDYTADGGAPNYAFRFSIDDGGTWCYGDLDGHGANGAGQAWDGFRGEINGSANLGVVTP
jgi:hypothetical protein